MEAFRTLLKNELKLNIRNMNMVIFAVIIPLGVFPLTQGIQLMTAAKRGAGTSADRTSLHFIWQHPHLFFVSFPKSGILSGYIAAVTKIS